MTANEKRERRRKAAAQRRMSRKIEQVIYDYVWESFGRSEAECPSWYIPELADVIAESMSSKYMARHEIHYDQ